MSEGFCVVIVSPSELLREGVRRVLTAKDVATDRSVDEIEAAQCFPDGSTIQILFLTGMTVSTAADSCRAARLRFPAARIVVTMENSDVPMIASVFGAGADSVFGSDLSCDQLVGALKLAALGQRIVPNEFIRSIMNQATYRHIGRSIAGANLSGRENGILQCLVAGHPNKVISRHLEITEATVKVHIKAILRKLHVANRTQAAIWAVNQGVVASTGATDQVTQMAA